MNKNKDKNNDRKTVNFLLLTLSCDNGHQLLVPMGYRMAYICEKCGGEMYSDSEPESFTVDLTPRQLR